MGPEVFSIIDTAVKIGLGALISGVATYRVTKLNHDRDAEKIVATRKREIIEQVAGQTEVFSNAVLVYWAYMVEFVRYRKQDKSPPKDLDAKLESATRGLFDKYAQLSDAEGKLILLGADDAQTLIREFGEYVKEFRRVAWQGNSELTEEKLHEFRESILEKRKALFKEIRSAYMP